MPDRTLGYRGQIDLQIVAMVPIAEQLSVFDVRICGRSKLKVIADQFGRSCTRDQPAKRLGSAIEEIAVRASHPLRTPRQQATCSPPVVLN